jgi:hypothetical protein
MQQLSRFIIWNIGLASATTQTTQSERELLASLAKGRKSLAEIGVWEGVTASAIQSVVDEDSIYYAIDPYPPGKLGFSIHRLIALSTVKKHQRGRVRWMRETGVMAAERLRSENVNVEFVFIDGDHSWDGINGDWLAWAPLVNVGGVICLHDSRSHAGREIEEMGSVKYTEDVIVKDPRFHVVAEVDSITAVARIR